MSILSNFTAYVKQVWANRPSLTSPLSATRFNYMEAGIKANSDAIEQIANAVLSNIVNDPNKIASMAVAYSLQEQVNKLNSDFSTTKNYVPNIQYNDGTTLTIENVQFKFAKLGKFLLISGRFNITNLGATGNKTLSISIPNAFTTAGEVGAGLYGYAIPPKELTEANLLAIRSSASTNTFEFNWGAGGDYVRSHLVTGFYGVFALIPIA